MSIRVIFKYSQSPETSSTKSYYRKLVGIWISLRVSVLMILLSVSVVLIANLFGYAPLDTNYSINWWFQTMARDAIGIPAKITFLTDACNISIVMVILMVPLALCVILASREDITKRYSEYQQLIYWTAFLLVAGVIQVTYQNRMPALFFDDDFNLQKIRQLASSAGLQVGGMFSVALALVFLPAGFILDTLLPVSKESQQNQGNKSWYTEIIAVLAPMLTALPISKLFDISS